MSGDADRLAALVRERGPCVVLTGAGMSAESGIPTFRSAGGLWDEVNPFEVASLDAFHRDPVRVWQWYGPRVRALLDAEPNPGHVALAALEREGHVTAVVTQNIDRLHTRAGSVEVLEVHGSIGTFVCLACGGEEVLDDVLRQLDAVEAPTCPDCETILKPGVVMFGELLPAATFARAESLIRDTGVLLVVGSSLAVWPVAGLPEHALRAGAALAIVDPDETPLDREADVVVRAAAGETLAALARALTGS